MSCPPGRIRWMYLSADDLTRKDWKNTLSLQLKLVYPTGKAIWNLASSLGMDKRHMSWQDLTNPDTPGSGEPNETGELNIPAFKEDREEQTECGVEKGLSGVGVGNGTRTVLKSLQVSWSRGREKENGLCACRGETSLKGQENLCPLQLPL